MRAGEKRKRNGMSDGEDKHACAPESGAETTTAAVPATPQAHHGILKHGSTEKKKKFAM